MPDSPLDPLQEQLPAPPPSAPTRACVACGEPLRPSAHLCPVCKSYQNTIRRRLQYGATLVGLISIASGLLVYIAGTSPKVWKAALGRSDVRVLGLNHSGMLVANIGDVPVTVGLLHIRHPYHRDSLFAPVGPSPSITDHWKDWKYALLMQLAPGEIKAYDAPSFLSLPMGGIYKIRRSAALDRTLLQAAADGIDEVVLNYWSANDPLADSSMYAIPTKGAIYYWTSSSDELHAVPFKALAVLGRSKYCPRAKAVSYLKTIAPDLQYDERALTGP